MKLLLILLLFPVVCFGQKKDSLPITKENGLSIWVTPANRQTTFTITSDTSKVIMLVSDTSFVSGLTSSYAFNDSTFYSIPNRMTYVWYQFGYSITIFHEGETDDGHHWPRQTEIYLDENKKPLPKSVIVWQTKKIKK